MDNLNPQDTYQARAAQFAIVRDLAARRSDRQANISLVLAIAALVALGVALWQQADALLVVPALLACVFVASFVWHGRINQRRDRAALRWTLNDEGLKRLRRDWANLPLRAPLPTDKAERDLANDLDLLGHASLHHVLGTASTPVGQATLQRWLLQPAAPAVITRRQQAVRELTPQIELREALAEQGRMMTGSQARYEQLVGWAESAPWLAQRHWHLWLARVLPLITLGLALAQLVGLVNEPLWLGGIFLGMLVTLLFGKQPREIIAEVAAPQSVFQAYADLFRLFGVSTWNAPELQRLHTALSASSLRADEQMQRLARLMPLADLRNWVFFAPIQYATLWDVHLVWLLERWQRDAGAHARGWLAALGELEALSALATLAFENPTWSFPDVAVEHHSVSARAIGHPLLPPERCVRNDVQIGPSDTFLLVTGSNMSGKSTLLRSIGVNIVLAQAGGPVCAESLQLPPLTLATSMRVQDSLEAGVSYFMAELQRLKAVVDAAEQVRANHGQLLFLLDEILHGTNTNERQIAARQIISYLLSLGALGAVSTHDLDLANTPELANRTVAVHLTETLTRDASGPKLDFDYTLRPGLATSTNALALVEIVGLPVGSMNIATARIENTENTELSSHPR